MGINYGEIWWYGVRIYCTWILGNMVKYGNKPTINQTVDIMGYTTSTIQLVLLLRVFISGLDSCQQDGNFEFCRKAEQTWVSWLGWLGNAHLPSGHHRLFIFPICRVFTIAMSAMWPCLPEGRTSPSWAQPSAIRSRSCRPRKTLRSESEIVWIRPKLRSREPAFCLRWSSGSNDEFRRSWKICRIPGYFKMVASMRHLIIDDKLWDCWVQHSQTHPMESMLFATWCDYLFLSNAGQCWATLSP